MSYLKTRVPAVLTSDTVSARVVGSVASRKERNRGWWLSYR